MVATLWNGAPALSTVQKWAAEFRTGRKSLKDDPWSERSETATTEENIDYVHHMVMDDKQFTINQIADTVSISRESVENIPYNELDMTKVSACLLTPDPRLLTPEEKRTRLITSWQNLRLFEADQATLCFRLL
ncbi:uncharacterized protein LOC115212894 [Octopus sinensis]|uniref:Uncharacterized protein LOC115212894 n=1 Tax=Octopus sinensis TaxID=2607531 RepID=A0A6P7SH62_9MOLL|nr:uncharacterized protein LOC115212894 [Octopus sinensis]